VINTIDKNDIVDKLDNSMAQRPETARDAAVISFSLPLAMRRRLEDLSKKTQIPKSALIREGLELLFEKRDPIPPLLRYEEPGR